MTDEMDSEEKKVDASLARLQEVKEEQRAAETPASRAWYVVVALLATVGAAIGWYLSSDRYAAARALDCSAAYVEFVRESADGFVVRGCGETVEFTCTDGDCVAGEPRPCCGGRRGSYWK